ncbi:N-sulphoglucosamine sulphohydrolase-like [Physella acuta]|uniref:N-sulphoglucosamine sulphohydrolase-like n=1 Tax=Physella acuta TaxID=109671 RepID=UPI0027DE5A8B|nr:N-sulphoglucosamine sulphohydrolase-like [Physella acuta]
MLNNGLMFRLYWVVSVVFSSVWGKGVVLIIGGDAGLQIGAYNNTDARTPNLDSLANNGVIFTKAYTSSVSGGSPSRASLLTGLPAHQNGMFGSHGSPSSFRSYDDVISVSAHLSAEGVKTGIIGISGVGPSNVYKFDVSETEANNDEVLIGRNITRINELVQSFLAQYRTENFFLVISLADVQRCSNLSYGQFCEKWGDGKSGFGSIPDWRPQTFNSTNRKLPYFIPGLDDAEQDLADMYRGLDRLDQGVGLYVNSLVSAGLLARTLVIYTSTGGVAFPGAKYNAFESGAAIPLIVSSGGYSFGKVSDALVTSLDIFPTVLDYFGLPLPQYSIAGQPVTFTGRSLVPILVNPTTAGHSDVFATQEFVQVHEDLTLRSVRNNSFKLVWNKWDSFPIVSEIYSSPTFTRLVNKTKDGDNTHWWISLDSYLTRKEYELYDFSYDPYEVLNVAHEARYADVLSELKNKLEAWQRLTFDPWICPRGFVNIEGNCTAYM